jgi:integrase
LITAGATHPEALSAYQYCNRSPAPLLPHRPSLTTTPNTKGLHAYLLGRRLGYTHKAALAVLNRYGLTQAAPYFRCIAAATPSQLRSARRKGIRLTAYAYLLDSGATPSEILSVHKAHLDLYDYAHHRRLGLDHAATLPLTVPVPTQHL